MGARRGAVRGGRRCAGRRASRRGFLFTIDALLAAMLLAIGVILISRSLVQTQTPEQTQYLSEDVISALSTLRVREIQDSWVQQRIADGTIENPDITVLEQVGTFWATGNQVSAQELAGLVLSGLLDDYSITLTMGGDTLYEENASQPIGSAAARRMISGIAKGEALEGSTGSALLKRIKEKSSYAIVPFGGYVGQGNITVILEGLPADISTDRIEEITLQLDTVGDYDLEINGDPCITLDSDGNLSTVQRWDATACNASIIPGENNFTLITTEDIADAYVAGGFIKVQYRTDEFQDINLSSDTVRYRFPAIDGVINLYDSFYAQGVITGWTINVSYRSNYTSFLRIGNETIFNSPGNGTVVNSVFVRQNLSLAPIALPIRFGTTNFTNVTIISDGQAADTVLVTDVSGSMGDCGEWYTGTICRYRCSWWWFSYWLECPYPGSCSDEECGACNPGWTDGSYSTPTDTICSRTKLEVVQAADKIAIDITLNNTGNRVGLVSYNNRVRNTMDLTDDSAALKSQIDGYSANAGTCICCGINRAKNMLKNSPNKRFMIVLSDGDANYRCGDFDDYVGTYDSTNGPQSAIDAGQNACDNHNITVYTIGLGDAMSAQGQLTLQQTACNSSLYFNATNISQLEEIYRNITTDINVQANFSAQTILINGSFQQSSILPGSYIDFTYTPLISPPEQNEIAVRFETPQFSDCMSQLTIPSGMRVADASVTSYSGPYWTSGLIVNGVVVYNLSDYNTNFTFLGDPFLVNVPVALLSTGNNTIQLVLEDNNRIVQNCSDNNSIFYTGLVNSSVPRSDVLRYAEGCNWTVEFEDGSFLNVAIPSGYAGTRTCNYTSSSHGPGSYNETDAYDYAMHEMMRSLDFDGDGRIFVNLDAADLEIIVTVVSQVPYLWGPSFAQVVVER